MSLEVKQLLHDLDLLDFLEDQDIPYETSGKNIGTGWAGLEDCPFNGCPNFHFGINISNKSINCWVCGVDGTVIKLIMKLNRVSAEKALSIIQESVERSRFTSDMNLEDRVKKTFTLNHRVVEEEEEESRYLSIAALPGDRILSTIVEKRPKLKAYLKKRKISIRSCIKHRLRYDTRSLRLIAPIFNDKEKIIAYQGRDITDKAYLPYITQPKDAPLGDVLFNMNNNSHHAGILVEGFIDAIRMEEMIDEHIGEESICSVACFTNKPTDKQLELIAEANWKVLFVAFDYDSWTNYKKVIGPTPVQKIILPRGKDPAKLSTAEFINLNLVSFI